MTQISKKIAIIDGYSFVFRAYHSLPPLTNPEGTPVGAVYGFINMLVKLLAQIDASHIVVTFDSGSKTFRNDIYPNYKANRPPCPEDLIPQFPLVREAVEALNLPILEKVGFEADDLIASVTKKARNENFEVVIVSSDKDLMQLIDEKTIMYDAMRDKEIGFERVKEKFGVAPNQVLDVLALMGDSSDNIPGVKGIGAKSAADLINEFGNLENLLENLDKIPQKRRRQLMEEGVEMARLSKILVSLKDDLDLNHEMADFALRKIIVPNLLAFLQNQGFRSLLARVERDFGQKAESAVSNSMAKETNSAAKILQNFSQIKSEEIVEISVLEAVLVAAKKDGNLVFDICAESKIITLSYFADDAPLEKIYYLFFAQKKADLGDLFLVPEPEENSNALNLAEIQKIVTPFLQDEAVKIICYGAKEIIKLVENPLKVNAHDVAILGYILNSSENKTNLDALVINHLDGVNLSDEFSENFQILAKNKIPEKFSQAEILRDFYVEKNFLIALLFSTLKADIFGKKLNNVYHALDRPLLNILAKMEQNGIFIDGLKLKKLSDEFALKIQKLGEEIYVLAGEEFNIASPKQLGEILFNKLGLSTTKKTSKGKSLSTKSEVLEDLDLAGHEIARKILEWRQFSKLKSTYTDALPKAINEKTKRIHSNFSSISTITGRLSSNNPNLQNIPIRTREGRKIRQSFMAPKNSVLICADYSQIELRVVAQMAEITALKQAFIQDKDIHSITAAQVFGVEESEVDQEMRRRAKAINFGIIYGISAFGLAGQLRISRGDAKNYIDDYFNTYPGIKEYMEKYQQLAQQNGFVQTIFGRKCFVKDINSNNPILKGLAQRLAINAPIQGSAADIMKKAMIDCDFLLQKFNHKKQIEAKMVLQIHDELIVECPKEYAEELADLLRKTMAGAFILDIPLKVDVNIGEFWY